MVTLNEFSYIDGSEVRGDSGFNSWYVPFDEDDMRATFDLIGDWLESDFQTVLDMVYDSYMSTNTSTYIEELKKHYTEDEGTYYEMRGQRQPRDLVLFAMSYVKYAAIKMMLQGTWNWRVSIFGPYTLYDQLVCSKAREMDIDVIVLSTENSTGVYAIRTEILDTRSRQDSTNNLFVKGDDITLRRVKYEKAELKHYLSSQEHS